RRRFATIFPYTTLFRSIKSRNYRKALFSKIGAAITRPTEKKRIVACDTKSINYDIDIAPEIHYAFRGLAMSLLTRKERSLWGLIVFAFPQESSCISFAKMVFDNVTIQSGFTITMVVWSGGPLTPGSAITRPTENICGNSTCLKAAQEHDKGGRLAQCVDNDADIPRARARRLKPCGLKATSRSGKHMHSLRSLQQLRTLKATAHFDGTINRSPNLWE